jgi:hypothetical protein
VIIDDRSINQYWWLIVIDVYQWLMIDDYGLLIAVDDDDDVQISMIDDWWL